MAPSGRQRGELPTKCTVTVIPWPLLSLRSVCVSIAAMNVAEGRERRRGRGERWRHQGVSGENCQLSALSP